MAKRPRGCSNSNLDRMWSKRVKEEADYTCEIQAITCGGPLSSHHFYGRRNRATRWYVKNGVCLCANHHTLQKYSAHLNVAWFQREMEKLRGTDWLDELIVRAATIFKWQHHLEEIRDYLKGEIDDYL